MNEQEDAVLIDAVIRIVTSPIWITCFCALVIAGAWNSRKAKR